MVTMIVENGAMRTSWMRSEHRVRYVSSRMLISMEDTCSLVPRAICRHIALAQEVEVDNVNMDGGYGDLQGWKMRSNVVEQTMGYRL